ncbi:hypothetical protein RvY_08709 [Ramazzottius varieornatus]|uniref:Uncharacterized protein n=1 Tax=Ramazzottius varieornatus TaxID=947166 RepID=A0A1D1VBF7_RAMVA|nr:hypothetical protein RvY_08709 [Ramazzottius varieornatus]
MDDNHGPGRTIVALERGRKATQRLRDEGPENVEFLQQDVTQKVTIDAVRDWIQQKHGALDILVNNAGTVGVSTLYLDNQ